MTETMNLELIGGTRLINADYTVRLKIKENYRLTLIVYFKRPKKKFARIVNI